jgi:lipopolysaccharide transport system ATP-binding protein
LINWIKHPFNKNGRHTPETIFALKDINFKVDDGEVLGIIGRNGAGKSTLLKILSKISYPTSGTVRIKGRLAALLEVGTGFHGDLTGRENIYLNGSILGMTKKELESKLDAIVNFAGVEKFLDTPVKRYSSGMFLRLGFAVAAHLEPDVLLVDEVLAVGDSAFQKKCLNAMDEMRSGGRTVLFVSHNMAAVENLCSRALWIDNAQIRLDGPAKSVIEAYMAANAEASCLSVDLTGVRKRHGTGSIKISKVEILGPKAEPFRFVCAGDSIIIRVHYLSLETIRHPEFEIKLYTELGTLITRFCTAVDFDIPSITASAGWIDLMVDCLNFQPGRYYLSLTVSTQGPVIHDELDHCLQFEVEASNFYGSGKGIGRYYGIIFLSRKWRHANPTLQCPL